MGVLNLLIQYLIYDIRLKILIVEKHRSDKTVSIWKSASFLAAGELFKTVLDTRNVRIQSTLLLSEIFTL